MPNGSLMEMMGYKAGGLPELFGQYFEDVDPRWTQMFEPQFEATRTALGELPGQRRGMLEQLTGGLQQRGVAAGRALQGRRAGAGFAGAGAIERFGRTARQGLEQEYGRGMWGIEQDIARKRAGVLGGLRGRIGSFLEQLMAAGTTAAAGVQPPYETTGRGEAARLGLFEEEPVADISELPESYSAWLLENPGGTYDEYQEFVESLGY